MITSDWGQGHATNSCILRRNHRIIETCKHQVRNIAIKTLLCWLWETFFPGNNMIVPTSVHVLNEWTIQLHILELSIPPSKCRDGRSLMWSGIESNVAERCQARTLS